MSKAEIKNLFQRRQIKPLRGLGQNFLADKGALQTIIEAADIKPDEIVLEIGPGTGVLTLELAKYAKKVIAVEKDAKMVEILKETLKGFNNIEVIQGDILVALNPKSEIRNPKQIPNYKLKIPKHYKVVANLPFYITAPVIRRLLEAKNPPKEIVLMVQKEVGQRICAKPPDMTLLAVSVQFYAEPKIVDYISKKSFWPSPKVDSAIIKIMPRRAVPQHDSGLREQFFKIVRSGFSHPRKQLINNLSTGLSISREQIKTWLQKNKVLPEQRAETLTVNQWIELTESIGR
jgi:16S rRNA (adenine1518-N6/adenine1519-N6)-dimethyltransferase